MAPFNPVFRQRPDIRQAAKAVNGKNAYNALISYLADHPRLTSTLQIEMINWQEIETVLFDMDGTLLDLHFDNYFWSQHLPKRYAQLQGISEADAGTRLHQLILAQHGSLNFYCIDYWSEQLDVDIAAMKYEVQNRISFLPHAETLLNHLKKLPVKTVIVTNAHRKTLAVKESVLQISNYVDGVWASHDFGLPKEDPEFWPTFALHYRFNPAKTVFVDDNEAVLAAAAQFNIQHLVMPLNPDSQRPAQAVSEPDRYLAIDSLHQLLPANVPASQG